MRILLITIAFSFLASCVQDRGPFEFDPNFDPEREIAEDVEMIYSDSAKLQFIIQTPRLEKYNEDRNTIVEEFPKGIHIDFYNPNGEISSTLSANYAERRSAEGTMLLRDSVILDNGEDRLETIGVTWNEEEQTLKTAKWVQLIQGATKDTLWGYGLDAKDDFSQFRIGKPLGKRRYQDDENP